MIKEVKQAEEECRKHGIEVDQRWEKDTPHHPEAERIYKLLEESDWLFGSDFFRWKSGGDGDNGESLMYSLSTLLELKDAKGEVKQCIEEHGGVE